MKRYLPGAVVSCFILLIVIALLMPAWQGAREAARVEHKSAADVAPASAPSQYGLRGNNNGWISTPPQARFAEGSTIAEELGQQPAGGDVILPTGHQRKIIYSANVELVVEDFDGMADKVAALAKQFDAYVAGSNLTGSTGETRRGNWKLRVPTARFDEFVAAAKGLGELQSAGTTSKDVSEEYYDVDARIRNKTKEEERLLKLLEERPGKLEDVIAIERELSRVRGELERMQGRMRRAGRLDRADHRRLGDHRSPRLQTGRSGHAGHAAAAHVRRFARCPGVDRRQSADRVGRHRAVAAIHRCGSRHWLCNLAGLPPHGTAPGGIAERSKKLAAPSVHGCRAKSHGPFRGAIRSLLYLVALEGPRACGP